MQGSRWSRLLGRRLVQVGPVALLATFVVFAAGVYTGRAFPNLLGDRVPAPVAAAEF